ncbi:unnamed protein product [Sphenostylis stenocarpa]|uniref:Uncharacterized protein n=1 Tax=Sphenostylis stenocarpa TaxID=92480 RepID=A0AA86VY81_9FABA|nr:unnamed protein product [Sphenostylis stenocarpa]
MSVSNASSIPPRPPRRANIGFETIVNKKLASNQRKKKAEKNPGVGGSLKLLIQSIFLSLVWLWRMTIRILNVWKIRIYSKIFLPKTRVGVDTTGNEKLQRSRRDGFRVYKRKETLEKETENKEKRLETPLKAGKQAFEVLPSSSERSFLVDDCVEMENEFISNS